MGLRTRLVPRRHRDHALNQKPPVADAPAATATADAAGDGGGGGGGRGSVICKGLLIVNK